MGLLDLPRAVKAGKRPDPTDSWRRPRYAREYQMG